MARERNVLALEKNTLFHVIIYNVCNLFSDTGPDISMRHMDCEECVPSAVWNRRCNVKFCIVVNVTDDILLMWNVTKYINTFYSRYRYNITGKTLDTWSSLIYPNMDTAIWMPRVPQSTTSISVVPRRYTWWQYENKIYICYQFLATIIQDSCYALTHLSRYSYGSCNKTIAF